MNNILFKPKLVIFYIQLFIYFVPKLFVSQILLFFENLKKKFPIFFPNLFFQILSFPNL